MKKSALILIACFTIAGAVSGQTTPAGGAVEWMRVQSPSRDLSFALPVTGDIVFNDDGGYRIWHNESGVSLSFIMLRNVDGKLMLKQSVPSSKEKRDDKLYQKGDFLIRQYSSPDEDSGIEYQYLSIASSKGYYSISARVTKDPENVYTSFLHSIRLEDAPLFVGTGGVLNETRTTRINDLKTDDVVLDALRRPDAKSLKLEPGSVLPAGTRDRRVYSRELIILRKPYPSYTDSARHSNVHGTVALRITLGSDGQISHVVLVKSLDKGLDRSALDAAKRIKFIPAEVDGKPVDAVRTVEYSFAIH